MGLPQPSASEVAADDSAYAEAISLHTGRDPQDREALNKIKQLERDDSVYSHLHRLIVIIIWAVGLTSLAMFVIVSVHYVLPKAWQFLDKDQISEIRGVLLSNGLGALIGFFGKRYLQKD